jgi:drug/metabolite transporter (DMT)-like permease
VGFLAAGITVILWASAFAGIRAGMSAYTPPQVAVLRYLTASLVLGGYALVHRMRLPKRRDLPAFIGLGAAGITVYNLALNTGERMIPSAVASFLIAAAPVFMALEARLFLHEHLRRWGWLGIGISLAGVGLISWRGATEVAVGWPIVLVVVAAIAQSMYSTGQKAVLRRYTPLECTSYAIWAGTALLLPFAGGLPQRLASAPLSATAAIVFLGVFPGAIAYLSWAYALSRLPASTAASFLYGVPVVALFIAWLWLGEVPTGGAVLGGGIVVVGVMIVNTRGRAHLHAPQGDSVGVGFPAGAGQSRTS